MFPEAVSIDKLLLLLYLLTFALVFYCHRLQLLYQPLSCQSILDMNVFDYCLVLQLSRKTSFGSAHFAHTKMIVGIVGLGLAIGVLHI